MLCSDCNVVMGITGTTYEKKKNNRDRGYRRFNKCPKCKKKIYNNSDNFQEHLAKASEKSRSM